MKLKYKVIKDFGAARKGDVLINSVNDPQVFTIEVCDGDIKSDAYSYRSMSISDDIADLYTEEGYLEAIEEAETPTEKAVALIDDLVNKYQEDYDTIMSQYEIGKVQPCVKTEAETVLYNLTKVLERVKKELTDEQIG